MRPLGHNRPLVAAHPLRLPAGLLRDLFNTGALTEPRLNITRPKTALRPQAPRRLNTASLRDACAQVHIDGQRKPGAVGRFKHQVLAIIVDTH